MTERRGSNQSAIIDRLSQSGAGISHTAAVPFAAAEPGKELRSYTNHMDEYSGGSGYPAMNQETDLPHIEVPVVPLIDDQLQVVNEVDGLLQEARQRESESNNKREAANTLLEKAMPLTPDSGNQ